MHGRHEIDGNGAKRRGGILAVMLVAVLGSNAAAAAPSAPCDMQFTVELTPDVPNPSDAGFLSSLLSNHVGYRLTLRRQSNSSAIVLDLTGPGPDYRCQDVVEAMRKDGRVRAVHVYDAANSDQEQADAIVTARLLPEETPHTHLSLAGIGSLYWAAGHPAQAWRVLLPIQPRVGPDVTADLKARCIVFTESPSGRGAGCYFDAPDNVMH